MKVFRPNNLKELLNFNERIRRDGLSPYTAFFRGQTFDWPIKPNITRNEKLSSSIILNQEKVFFSDYTEEKLGLKVLSHFKSHNTKFAQVWHNLFQAQHLGFYTRLTDWTEDIDVAMFFAVDDENGASIDENGVLYFYACPYYDNHLIKFYDEEYYNFYNKNPFELDRFYLIKHPSMCDDGFKKYAGEVRRFRQNGSFIISPSNEINVPLEEVSYIKEHLIKIIITPAIKKEIKVSLNKNLRKYIYYASEENNETDLQRIRDIASSSNTKLFWSC